MKEDIRYNSQWDKSTWLIISLVAFCCVFPCFMNDGIWPVLVCCFMLLFVLVTFKSVYYRISGDKLVVYTFFRSKVYPIREIKEIRKTNTVLSAPATSLSHRIEIVFCKKESTLQFNPLIISPVHQEEFIRRLQSINPNIVFKE